MTERLSAREHAEAVLERYRGGLTWEQALVVACAERDGAPLDPFEPDAAAVICCAERLALGELPIRAAIQAGRDPLGGSRSAHPDEQPRRNGGPPGYGHELPEAPSRPVCDEPTHTKLWGARDGHWRCNVCEPPRFPGEIVRRAEVQA